MIAIIVFFISLFIFIIMRIPVYICLGLCSFVLWVMDVGLSGIQPAIFMQNMFAGINSFTIMAIPFFMLCGEIMNHGGLSKRLVVFAQECVGWVKGGLGYTAIIAGVIIAAILGNASASAVIIGSVMLPEMEKNGYRKDFSAALVASSGILGPIIPPSTIMIVYGVLAGVSITDLFIGGYLPGFLIAGLYMVYTSVHAHRHNYPAGNRPTFKSLMKSLWYGLPTLFLPIIIMGGIISGVFTPTEAGVIGVLYALIISLAYRETKLSDIPGFLVGAAKKTALILVVMSMAKMLTWVLTLEQIPQMITNAIVGASTSKWVFILMVNILMLVLGCILDTNSAIMLVAPMLLPVVKALGIDPIYFGVMICIIITMGNLTPPVGICLYATSGIAKLDILKLSKALIPFYILLAIALVLIATVEPLTTWLPALL